jgi:hypothetical protein
MVRLQPRQLASLDAWIGRQESAPSRPEAVRRLIDQALASEGADRPTPKAAVRKASKLAARELEALGDTGLPPEEQDRRKRALIKGPKEFRDVRADLPKKKI